MLKALSIILFSLLSTVMSAQHLMTIGNEKVMTDEFLKIYQKNNHAKISYSQKDIQDYVELFTLFKMKLQEARLQKMDTLPTVVDDYNHYTNQLLINTVVDKSYVESILKSEYEHMKYDVRVAHIMVKCSPNAEPKDTLLAFNKLKYIKEKTTKDNFAAMAKENSEDKNSGVNGGEIGFITAFMTLPDFENECYQTPVGQVSGIFRTQFGYHIIHVMEKRPARGRVKIAHIFAKKAEDKSDEKSMQEAYQAILSKKMNWSDAVKKYSQDVSSKEKGGEIPEFGVGEMVPEFEDQCFLLKNAGDVSRPFQTSFGWHIVKLIEKNGLKSYELSRDFIKSKMERDPRISDLQSIAYERLTTKYRLQENGKALEYLSTAISDSFFVKPQWNLSVDKNLSSLGLFTFGGKSFTVRDFISYSNKNLNTTSSKSKKEVLPALYKAYKDRQIWSISKQLMSQENADFKNLETEYISGLLIYEIMDKEIWRKAIMDTIGAKKVYESVKNDYWYKDRAVIEGLKTKNANVLAPYLDRLKSSTAKKLLAEIKKTKDSNDVVLYEQTIEKGEIASVDQAMADISKPFQFEDEDNMNVLGKIVKILPPSIKSYMDIRGRIQNLYQNQLEKEWNAKLRAKYPVQIIQTELDKIIKN